MQARLSI